jgi:hypothetical protein
MRSCPPQPPWAGAGAPSGMRTQLNELETDKLMTQKFLYLQVFLLSPNRKFTGNGMMKSKVDLWLSVFWERTIYGQYI